MAVYAQYLLDNGLPDFTWAQHETSGAYWHNGESFGFSSVLVIHRDSDTATFIILDTPISVVDLGLSLHQEVAPPPYLSGTRIRPATTPSPKATAREFVRAH